jgi:hypothetical protein
MAFTDFVRTQLNCGEFQENGDSEEQIRFEFLLIAEAKTDQDLIGSPLDTQNS